MEAGSCGAIQGANNAKIMKITTNTTPVAAKGLRRAVRRNEMAAADMSSNQWRTAQRRSTTKLSHFKPDLAVAINQFEIGLV
jgi:hypothetical protein